MRSALPVFREVETKTLPSGVVLLHYQPAGK